MSNSDQIPRPHFSLSPNPHYRATLSTLPSRASVVRNLALMIISTSFTQSTLSRFHRRMLRIIGQGREYLLVINGGSIGNESLSSVNLDCDRSLTIRENDESGHTETQQKTKVSTLSLYHLSSIVAPTQHESSSS